MSQDPITPSSPTPTTPPTPPLPYPPQPPAAAGKSGLPWWGWVGLGCGCMLVLGGLAIAGMLFFGARKVVEFAEDVEKNPALAVEKMIAMSPDLEVVESDHEAGTITIRNIETGEVSTFDFSDVLNGRISFESEDGSFGVDTHGGTVEISTPEGTHRVGAGASVDDIPDWVPLFDEATPVGGMTSIGEGRAGGTMTFELSSTTDEALAFYREFFADHGWSVRRLSSSDALSQQWTLQGTRADDDATLNVVVADGEDGRVLVLAYEGPADD